MQTPPTPQPNPSIDLSSLDVTQLRAAHYQLHYPSPSFLPLHHAPWTDMVVNMYRDFLNKVWTTAKLEEETRGSLYRVCATKAPLPYRAPMIDSETFRQMFVFDDPTMQKEVDYYVSGFLQGDFLASDIDERYSRDECWGLPLGFTGMLSDLCADTVRLVDFMEASARGPFVSDINCLIRNFCYHVLVKDIAQPRLWEKHATQIFQTYTILFNELNKPPHKYGVIREFLKSPHSLGDDDAEMDEILKRYMVSTAMFKFFQNETSSVRATHDALKCSKVAVEEVEACRLEASHSRYSDTMIVVCNELTRGIRLSFWMQCLCDAKIRSGMWYSGGNLETHTLHIYGTLASEGRSLSSSKDSREIEKWALKVYASHNSQTETESLPSWTTLDTV